VTATRSAAPRTAHSASGARGASVPRPAVEALNPVIDRVKVRLAEERVVILTNPFIRIGHARKSVVPRTANSLNGVSGEDVPRHVEEAHRCVPEDVRAGSVVEKDVLGPLPTDVPATLNAALRTVTSASGVRGTSVPRPAV